MRKVSWLLMAALMLTVGLVAMACMDDEEEAIPLVAVGAADYSFTAPDSIAGGIVRVAMTNNGKEDHHVAMLRLNPGVTQQQFRTTLADTLKAAATEGEAAFGRLFAVVTPAGGSGGAAPGKQDEMVLDLKQGEHVMVCFLPGPDGVPHIAKGMVKAINVTAPAAEQPSPPAVKGTVELADFAFTSLPEIGAGKTTVQVVNKGKEPHEMILLRPKGVTVAQLQQILTSPPPPPGSAAPPAGPPPFEAAGGFFGVEPGGRGWATLNLTAGEYLMVCFFPSPANQGKPHLALGMIRPLTVK